MRSNISGMYVPQTTITPVTSVMQQAYRPSPPTPDLGAAFKPKKAGKSGSHIIFVLDDSGSMQSCRQSTIDGFNEYLQGQQTDARRTGIVTYVSLYKFDGNNVKCVIDHVDVQEAPPLDMNSYNPQGGTNLYDAIGGVLMQINNTLAAKPKKERESVILTILTDGEENSSRTFRSTDVKAMVEKAEAKNWGFMFLGANIDAFSAGSVLGFGQHNTMQYSASATSNAIRSASEMTSRMKHAYDTGVATTVAYMSSGFTDQERVQSVTPDDNQ